jgi:hypothetical protein
MPGDELRSKLSFSRKRMAKAVLTSYGLRMQTHVVSASRSCGHYGLVLCRIGGCGNAEVPGQEFFDAVDGVIGDAGEDIRQIGFRIDTVEFRRSNQAVHSGGAVAASIRS